MEVDVSQIKSLVDSDGKLISLPSKHKKKLIALWYLAEKIPSGKDYTEREINELLNSMTVFRDPATLRRELYDRRLLERTSDCRRYWKESQVPPLNEFVENNI